MGILILIAVVAFLYASVGHAGASGYIAVLILHHVPPQVVKPSALVLNIFVASIASFKFFRAGYFSWKIFTPLALASVPAAFCGGFTVIPGHIYQRIVGAILVYIVISLFLQRKSGQDNQRFENPPTLVVSLVCGAGIGFLSGLVGVGGGIFLTPLLVLRRWACIKTAAGVSAMFILVNSLSGLAGFLRHGTVPSSVITLVPAAIIGGYIGAELGSRYFPYRIVRIFLAIVLMIAAYKLLF